MLSLLSEWNRWAAGGVFAWNLTAPTSETCADPWAMSLRSCCLGFEVKDPERDPWAIPRDIRAVPYVNQTVIFTRLCQDTKSTWFQAPTWRSWQSMERAVAVCLLSAEMNEQEGNREENLSQTRVSRRASWKRSFPENNLIISLPEFQGVSVF